MTTFRVYENVTLGEATAVEDFCIIGAPPRGSAPGELPTTIGPGSLLRSHTVVYAGNVIGRNFQTGNKVNIRESNRIGDNVSIGTLSVIEHHVDIGNNVRIHSQAFIPEFSVLEDSCWIGPNVVFTNAKYPESPGVKDRLAGPIVRKGARIGANATLLPGVVIGEYALVGAGTVVVRDVPPGAVVVGNPGLVVRHISELPYATERIGPHGAPAIQGLHDAVCASGRESSGESGPIRRPEREIQCRQPRRH